MAHLKHLLSATLSLIPLFLIHPWLLATDDSQSTTPTLTATDPSGNLSGDPDRSYLDLIRVELHLQGPAPILELGLDGPLPSPAFLLGTGFRWVIRFGRDASAPEAVSPTLHRLDLRLTQHHWDWELHSDTLDGTSLETEISIEATSRTLRIHLPSALLQHASFVSVSATTEDYPKWTPITTHPPVILRLKSDPLPQR